ncbi:hypothetical protein MPTK1_3g05620 [Marchantia polymorpha subsp. ruderalis]|uniref:Uncharacterized protein n=2 Tax=Marchantia polymorpha TaxID=3197 RepID=A0AAF6AXR7_MARPO|nr:hypothetical protein MARPO_0006s0034 [Marchantia polymorpha]BBN04551.1 hypothetical protein Mp_3g05620 [Marchantia polymorpha subsp. ruderalis]|eukprot:PTQ47989.1 hypothetical protein MARPO_0006s0034 [Marchantia polymorpha]
MVISSRRFVMTSKGSMSLHRRTLSCSCSSPRFNHTVNRQDAEGGESCDPATSLYNNLMISYGAQCGDSTTNSLWTV